VSRLRLRSAQIRLYSAPRECAASPCFKNNDSRPGRGFRSDTDYQYRSSWRDVGRCCRVRGGIGSCRWRMPDVFPAVVAAQKARRLRGRSAPDTVSACIGVSLLTPHETLRRATSNASHKSARRVLRSIFVSGCLPRSHADFLRPRFLRSVGLARTGTRNASWYATC
jgi:hypothetical protein